MCEFATTEKSEKGLLRARLLKQFISRRGRWRAESWQRRPIGLGGIAWPVRREAACSGCRVGDLTRTEGTSTWFIEVVAVWRTRTSRGAAGRVGDGAIKLAVIGAVTEEAKRFSLTQERDGWVHSSKSTGPNSGTDVGGETARRRNCSS